MDENDTTTSKKLAGEIVRLIASKENVIHEDIMVALCILVTTFACVQQLSVEHFKVILDTMLIDFENEKIRNQDI